jgi:phage terminase large subunit-like protein
VPESEIIVVAASRDQATVLLDAVRAFVRCNPALGRQLKVTQRTVAYPRLGGRLRVLSADVATAEGTVPTLGLVDELHRHKSPERDTLLRDGLFKRGGRMVTISTAGVRGESPLWELRERALALPSARRDACLLTARSDGFARTEWSVPDDGDPDDIELVKQANPASWHTLQSLRERHDSPSTIASEWKRFACDLWVERAEVEAVFDAGMWTGLVDTHAQPLTPSCFAIDATMDRSSAAIAVAAAPRRGVTKPRRGHMEESHGPTRKSGSTSATGSPSHLSLRSPAGFWGGGAEWPPRATARLP